MGYKGTLVLMLASVVSGPVVAQTAQTRQIAVQFRGTVTNDVADTITIRQPDGTFTPYRGPVPAFEYRKGDAVTIGFTTDVPTSAYYAANPQVPKAADGIYRFAVQGPNAGTQGFGVTRNFDISGSLGPSVDFGIGGITLVFDANADRYTLEFPRGQWTADYFRGSSYQYDATTGALVSVGRNCFGPSCTDGASLRGDAAGATLTSPIGTTAEPGNGGFFSLLFGGSWNLPVTASSSSGGGATPVPEPGTLLLFAGGLALLARRNRGVRR